MEQLKALLGSLSLKQKITILLAVAGVAAGLLWLSKWNKERDFRPLYTNLASEDAGAIAGKLKEAGVEYRVGANGDTILVPSARVAEIRLQMAAAGLPKTGRIGYELFDKMNFGITEFAEQVNYHRALEGEIERSVMAIGEVEHARVHITLPKHSLFVESRQPAKASVMIKVRTGARIDPQNVVAISHLVASAVEGLTPEGVSVLDMRGNLLSKPKRSGELNTIESSDAALEYRQKLERDLLAKIASTLEPLVGPDRFRTGVSLECDFTTGEQSEETFDPNKSVMVTSQKTEDISGVNQSGGVPGTASNLPRPASRPGSGTGGVTRRTENISYQSSRLVRRLQLPQGTVKRMSISVLVDHNARWEGSGPKAKRIIEPPSPEKLKVIRDLVAAVTGLQTERGDQLIVESLPFESTLTAEPPAVPRPPDGGHKPPPDWQTQLQELLKDKNVAIYGGLGAGAFLILSLLFFAMRRNKRKKKSNVDLPDTPSVLARGSDSAPALASGEEASFDVRQKIADQIAEQEAQREQELIKTLSHLNKPPVKTQKIEVLQRHISDQTKKDPQTVANILRTWLNER